MQNRRGNSWSVLIGVAIVAVFCAAQPAPAGAAPAPGTPLAVAPGVPGQGRAWELVTPPDPVSAVLWSVYGFAPDGNQVIYATLGLLPDAPDPGPMPSTALATRGTDGWTSATIPAPNPQAGVELPETAPVAIGPDFERSVWVSETVDGALGLFRSPSYGSYTQLLKIKPTWPIGGIIGPSGDTERAFAESEEHILPADTGRTSGGSIYEAHGSALRLVDVDDEGELISECGATGEGRRSVSADGSRIFFTASPGCAGPKRVFLRADASTTTEISASQCDLPDCGPAAGVDFVGATPSGAVAFLVTAQRLTDEDTDSNADLYRYDVTGGELGLVSVRPGGGDLIAEEADVNPVADGSRVFFRNVGEFGEGGLTGRRLYMADGLGVHPVSTAPVEPIVEVSENGRYAVFTTEGSLLATDTDAVADVYRYDAEHGDLTLISEGTKGGNGPFRARIAELIDEFRFYAGYRMMSEDGRQVFFASAEQLLPEDRNEVQDIYAWVDGDLVLVSSGSGESGSMFIGATPDGSTVLFRTADTLVPGDRDGGDMDFYVARIGGFPAPRSRMHVPAPARAPGVSSGCFRTAPRRPGGSGSAGSPPPSAAAWPPPAGSTCWSKSQGRAGSRPRRPPAWAGGAGMSPQPRSALPRRGPSRFGCASPGRPGRRSGQGATCDCDCDCGSPGSSRPGGRASGWRR